MKRWIVAISITLAACNGGHGGVDAGSLSGVYCGSGSPPGSCALPSQACCMDTGNPSLYTCYPLAGGTCTAGATVERCDGPEDCATDQVCCHDASTKTMSCVAAGACTSPALIVCHPEVQPSTCAAGARCCADLSRPGVLGYCSAGICPG
jgi:hypothetical protein